MLGSLKVRVFEWFCLVPLPPEWLSRKQVPAACQEGLAPGTQPQPPSPGACGSCLAMPTGSEATEEPKPLLLAPQTSPAICFVNTVYGLHRALTPSPHPMLGTTLSGRSRHCSCLQMRKLKPRGVQCPPRVSEPLGPGQAWTSDP